ncbi:methyltransferase family protein [Prochlorococcus marinus]|uniref:methyltransferase family protein n=1 Tax=Prochlorococcus marinus TaxID=1219 RepID=UPI0022B597DD|nr:isoprenylcysteine carboxylmethyltransferase family protein [Prochlorococcus marinus]
MNFKNNLLINIFSEWGFSRKGFLNNQNGEWWLLLQIFIIIFHLIPAWPSSAGSPISIQITSSIFFTIGLYRSILSLISLGASLSPLPEPKKSANLVTTGLYKYCRHPLYQSILIMSASYGFYRFSLIHLTLFILLSAVLIIKARIEENKLKQIHKEYKNYIFDVPAIFPGIKFYDWRI